MCHKAMSNNICIAAPSWDKIMALALVSCAMCAAAIQNMSSDHVSPSSPPSLPSASSGWGPWRYSCSQSRGGLPPQPGSTL